MNREILCKAKQVKDGAWVEGYYVCYGYAGKEKDYIVPAYASALYAIEVDPSTVSRFTGLTDKNGKRIWEGDIVRHNHKFGNGYGYVQYCGYGFFLHSSEDGMCTICVDFDECNWGEVEVIGNVHDNPELIPG